MVLATLPRVLGPTEKVKLPVTLFASDKRINKVKVDVKVEGPLTVSESTKTIAMPAQGDVTLDFDVDVNAEVGVGKVTVTASAGTFTGSDNIEIQVRNPNPPISQVRDQIIEAGKTWEPEVTPIGMNGTNTATVEVSTIPPINLGYRLKYLIEYPHGCIEQTTSSVFPQLFLDVVRPLTDREKSSIKNNITKGIERLKLFVTSDGGFGYWPGNNDADAWGSTYAGHFLLEAEAKGYYVPGDMIKRWKKYQKARANEWRNNSQYNYWDYMQAYRLYTLALAGVPELPAMNRLRESKVLSTQSGWMLAAAYATAGQPEVAKKLIVQLTTDIKPYQEMGYTYGSDIRDKAMILETLALLNDRPKAMNLLKEISQAMSNYNYWMSTQTTAYCLKAIGKFIGTEKATQLKFTYSFAGKEVNASTDLPLAQASLPITSMKPAKLKLTNQSEGVLFTRVLLTGTPAAGLEKDESNDLFMAVRYVDAKGNSVDPSRLTQGTEFMAQVTVKHMGYRNEYRNMALTQIFPSGWEINNARVTNDNQVGTIDYGDYQDIRDDRVYTYFSLNSGQARTFTIQLTAAYAGQFYLPAFNCEAMYDNSIYSRTKGMKVEVVKNSGI
jgi:alpha-2-macroglobulin